VENPAVGELERLRAENGQLRRIFADASVEFEKRNMRIASLEEELRAERERCRRLETACGKLGSELRREKARAEKFASMLFGLKSEKLRIEDIDLENTIVVSSGEAAAIQEFHGLSVLPGFRGEAVYPEKADPQGIWEGMRM